MSRPTPFSIEPDGPPLASESPLFGAGEAVCRPGPTFAERRYAHPCLGVVVEGAFDYRSRTGAGFAARGAVVFGNEGEPFACRHLDPAGNRRAVVAFHEDAVVEAANDCGLPEPAFGRAVLAPTRAAAGLYGAARRAAAGHLAEDDALWLLGEALRLSHSRPAHQPSACEEKRVGAALRRLEDGYDQPLTLDELADAAGFSRFHFVRVFRAVTGESPHQRLIGLRLRAAADRLLDTAAPVTEIAFAVGFNDLSHFNATFRRAFGLPPGAWRKAA
jgi:AraC-like DNA-binding protein